MALKHILTLVIVLLPSAARPDCASEARKARETILTSGPFQYTSKQWNRNFDRLQTGLIEPNKAEHILEKTGEVRGRHWAGGETILLGKQSWAKDSFGWLPPLGTVWSHQLTVPDGSYDASNTKCLGTVAVEGRDLTGYEQNARMENWNFIEKIFVESGSGLTVRYERTAAPGDAINVISTYRYDASIKIEPPKVDLAERQAKALQAFQLAAASSDPACRQEVIEIINRGQTASPFRYRIEGTFWNAVAGMHGTFVPPGSVHNIPDGGPGCSFAGGGGETVRINERRWECSHEAVWVSANGPSMGAMSACPPGAFTPPGFFVGASHYVGGAKCLGEVEKDGSRFRLYEYEVYADTHGMIADTELERRLVSKTRMFVDSTANLPTIFNKLDYWGQGTRQETRTYDKSITIIPPAGACSVPDPIARF